MKGIASFIVTIGSIVLALILLAGFAIFLQFTTVSQKAQIDAVSMSSTASNDLISALSYKTGAFTTALLLAGAAETGTINSVYDPTMIAFQIILKQRNCNNCLWFARVSSNNEQRVYPKNIEQSTIDDIISENKYYASTVIPTSKGALVVDFGVKGGLQ